MPSPDLGRDEYAELFSDLEAFFAYENGSTDSGVQDPEKRARRVAELRALNPWEDAEARKALTRWVREAYMSDEAIEKGYGWEDVLAFLRWLNEDA
jgi:hypothetical protein